MLKRMLFLMSFVLAIVFLASCGSQTDIVDSGTYAGTIKKVEADKREIYVTLEDEKVIELYFTDETVLTKNDQPAEFSTLTAGQKVNVTVKRTGNRLDPTAVNILE
jgi:CspA family cold shock protein